MLREALIQIREKARKLRRNHVALQLPEGVDFTTFRKIVEITFRTADMRINLHVLRGTQTSEPSYARMLSRQVSRRQPGAMIIISREGTEYLQLLKEVKAALKGRSPISIVRAQRTRVGNLLLQTEGALAGMKEAVKILEGAMDGARIRIPRGEGDGVELRLTNLDADVDIKKIAEAFKGQSVEANIKDLRMGFGEVQSATVVVPKEAAEEILKKGGISIGIGRCKIREYTPVLRCNRCWEPGHLARDCKGTDRGRLCMNCGEPGNKAGECKGGRKCLICETNGHRTLAGPCPALKRLKSQKL